MSLGSFFGGSAPKVDTSQYDAQIAAAKEQTAKAQQEAEQAKKDQVDSQNEIIGGNKARRANAASRFSLLLFEDEADADKLGA